MLDIPGYIGLVFGLTTVVTVLFFYYAARYSKGVLLILVTWLILQTILGMQEFYTVTDGIPPRFVLLVGPPLLFIIGLFVTPGGKRFLDGLNLKTLTFLHIIRVPVELTLYWLFIYKQVPQLMTFEGRNLDILSGLSAPFIWYFGFVRKSISKKIILIWNLVCLGLLINIVANAVLSVPFAFQQFAFDEPNVGLLYFPFVWLPGCIVPLVLLSHLTAIRQWLKK